MPRKSDFSIHVDSSCLTDSTDLKVPSKRNDSDQTIIHHETEDMHSDLDGGHASSQVGRDAHTEALIHAAARGVVASIEQDGYGQEDSVVSARTEEAYEGGTELTYSHETELTYENGTELTYDSEVDHSNQDPYDGSASSHHEDDVFSQASTRSNRSSLNSCTDEEAHIRPGNDDEPKQQHDAEQPEEHHSPISRMPSTSSNTYSLLPEPLAVTSPNPHTPSKVLSRPPFRTPSSVRAIQMSSPTPSIFSGSPRPSRQRTISRLGTPQAHNQSPTKTKTPTRFKAKNEYPLVLLHVTVLPLHWSCADALDAVVGEGLPRELYGVRESWKLLKEKLGDTVLERGILLPHPQDSYEVLEERFLEALELPVRPRAKILTCGHYLGPDDAEEMSCEDDSENEDDVRKENARERWCDICGKEVRYEELGVSGRQKRFRIKVYASNGLMRAGAWAAAWQEMERVDVEIEPFVPSHLVPLMDSLMDFHAQPSSPHRFDHEEIEDLHRRRENPVLREEESEDAIRRRQMEEERIREVYGHASPTPPEINDMKRPQRATSSRNQYGDSLPELMFAAIKVVMRDRKHVVICILSVLVLILALRPTGTTNMVIGDDASSKVPVIGTGMSADSLSPGREAIVVESEKVVEMPAQAQVVNAARAAADEAVSRAQTEPPAPPSIKHDIPKLQPEKAPSGPEIESLKEEVEMDMNEHIVVTPQMAE